MAEAATIQVQVCYAKPGLEFLIDLDVPVGATVQEAIFQSNVLKEIADIDLTFCRVGIYGKLKTLDTVLRQRDRVEIYRALIADPKEARRRRAAKRKG
jgi:putative ubiquitin-RnfH superfamily antitoxin RatB of RatAB toxin-antitoxin module